MHRRTRASGSLAAALLVSTTFIVAGAGAASADDVPPADPAPVVDTAPEPTPPASARDLVATAVPGVVGEVHVTWTAPADDGGSPLTGYSINASPEAVGVDAATMSSDTAAAPDSQEMTLGGLDADTAYVVTVTATTAAGSGQPAQVSVRTGPALPQAPTAVTAVPDDGSATVAWVAPIAADDVQGYVVTRTGDAPSPLLPATARSHVVTGLANGLPVSFAVHAVGWSGPGHESAPSPAVVPRLPARLVLLRAPAAAVTYGTASTVTAAVRRADGTGIAGQPVQLLAKTDGSSTWSRVASGTTGATGDVSLGTTLPATSSLLLRHDDGTVTAPDLALTRVAVRWRATATPVASTVRLGMTVIVNGAVHPSRPIGSPVQLQRLTSSGWVYASGGTMLTSSTFRASWRPPAVATVKLRVVVPGDLTHATGTSNEWYERVLPENALDLARSIRAMPRITLAPVHVGGRVDRATPRAVMADLAAGLLARRSSYGTAPGGSTAVSVRLLGAVKRMGTLGTVTVSEVTGGSHARRSKHYSGKAIDITWVNGRHVGTGYSYRLAVDSCRAFGAVVIYSPSYDPWGGHSRHVHCEWA